MSTPTYTLINQITLAANTQNIVFSSLPQNYKDLIVTCNARTDSGSFSNGNMRFNGDSAGNYSRVQIIATNVNTVTTTAVSGNTAIASILFSGNSALGTNIFQIMDYSAIDKNKTTLLRSSIMPTSNDRVMIAAARWASTAAINSINIFPSGATFLSGSTFSVYGIAG